jgi:hypothetical protein
VDERTIEEVASMYSSPIDKRRGSPVPGSRDVPEGIFPAQEGPLVARVLKRREVSEEERKEAIRAVKVRSCVICGSPAGTPCEGEDDPILRTHAARLYP